MSDKQSTTSLENIVSLCKRRGFIFPGSEVFGGFAGMWDYGPLGVILKENITRLWLDTFVRNRRDMHRVDAAILMKAAVWEASGHTGAGFADPMVECKKCNGRFRADQLSNSDATSGVWACEQCGAKNSKQEPRQFNMMFKTHVGALEDDASLSYLRPETAQGIFANFKNVVDAMHPKLPFGIAQIGKAFRNEIAPRDFIFRAREFEQMEIEYFVHPNNWEQSFGEWVAAIRAWNSALGFDPAHVHELEVPAEDRAHYSERTVDFEYDFPFGRKELYGLAYRTDHDLKNMMDASGVDMRFRPTEGEPFIPHVIEPSFGVDRTVLAVLLSAYTEDDLGGEKRTMLKLPHTLAPVTAAIFPLLKNRPELVAKAEAVFQEVQALRLRVVFDDNGNIGKRYRRQDEIGTPYCVTIDFETLENDTVTVRDRDSGAQERVVIGELAGTLRV